MRRTYRRRPSPTQKQPTFPINELIKDEEVMVIDENKTSLGVIKTAEALEMAGERGLDLVVVSPKANPPVAKFIDQGKFKYEQEKQLQKQKSKQKKVETKGIRLSFRIGKNDRDLKINQAAKFLEKGHKVKIETLLKGRERGHRDLAKQNIENFINDLGEGIVIEQEINFQGSKLSAVITRKK